MSGDCNTDSLSWSAYANRSEVRLAPAVLGGLLPLFEENSESVSMLAHSFDITMNSVEYLNKGQVPVLCMDAKLFVVGKTIQFNFPQKYGEDKLVLMMGPLHIEQAALKTLGDFMADSGWCATVACAGGRSAASAEAVSR